MDKCKNCGVEIVRNTGRRPKEFCSDSCRVKFWQKNKKNKSPNPEPKKKKEKTEPANNNPQSTDVKVNSSGYPSDDPKEGSMAFFKKYGYATYEEIEKALNNI